MTTNTPLMIAVAPNGARKSKADHAELPISATELGATAAACLEKGACMIHLHVRDEQHRHSLDPELYKEAIAAIRKETGNELIVQITTEAVGIYEPEEQVEIVKRVKPEAVSIALREIYPDQSRRPLAGDFFNWMQQERVNPQYILYDEQDIQRFASLVREGFIPGERLTVLLVLGRYTQNQQSWVEDLPPLVKELPESWLWWLCAFGQTELSCMDAAIRSGGHCRVGFENNLLTPEGDPAPNNAYPVGKVAELAKQQSRPLASANLARELMGFS